MENSCLTKIFFLKKDPFRIQRIDKKKGRKIKEKKKD